MPIGRVGVRISEDRRRSAIVGTLVDYLLLGYGLL